MGDDSLLTVRTVYLMSNKTVAISVFSDYLIYFVRLLAPRLVDVKYIRGFNRLILFCLCRRVRIGRLCLPFNQTNFWKIHHRLPNATIHRDQKVILQRVHVLENLYKQLISKFTVEILMG